MINETDVYTSTLKIAENLGIGFMMLFLVILFVVVVGLVCGIREDKK